MSSVPIKHLSKDKVLRKVITSVGPVTLQRKQDLYLALMRAIVGQQLSVKAAGTIWARFLALFPDSYPTPSLVLAMDAERFRGAGLSYQKAGYLKNIALFSIEKTLDYRQLRKLDDEALIDYLVQIKGVGRWTVEMILMFSLGRKDVFPKGDLGIVNGIRELYRIRSRDKKQLLRQLDRLAEQWRPYRTLACMYIWRSRDAKKS
jgi:DNA-3-methyladenine glycosylase II